MTDNTPWNGKTFEEYALSLFEKNSREDLRELFKGFTPEQKEKARILYSEWRKNKN